MRTKHKYKAQKVNTLDFAALKIQFEGKPLVLAVDVAKKEQYAFTKKPHNDTIKQR